MLKEERFGDSLAVTMSPGAHWFARVLEQEGLLSLELTPSSAPQGVVHGEFVKIRLDNCRTKAVITSHDVLGKHLGVKVRRVRAGSFQVGAAKGLARGFVFSGLFSNIAGYQSFGAHHTIDGKPISESGVVSVTLNGARIISLPWRMSDLPEGLSGPPHYIETLIGEGPIYAEVSPKFDDLLVRHSIFRAVLEAHRFANVPLVRVSPRLSGSGFVAVRIDADGFSDVSTQRVLNAANSQSIPMSWFLDVRSWKSAQEWVRRIVDSGSEIGVHAYHHMTFRSFRSNKMNFSTALKHLKKFGITPQGAVSPFGHWNSSFGASLASLGLKYSSEFAKTLDVLPHYSVFNGSPVLQIPTIPYSLGVWDGNASIWETWLKEIVQRVEEAGFAVMYDHPLGRLENHIDDFVDLIQTLKALGITFVTMQQIKELIEKRPKLERVQFVKGDLSYSVQPHESTDFEVEIIHPNSPKCSTPDASGYKFRHRDVAFRHLVFRSNFFWLLSMIPFRSQIIWASLREQLVRLARRIRSVG